LINKIKNIINEIENKVIAYRRDFHKHPETAWTEFRTASIVAKELSKLGYDLKIGRDVITENDRAKLPSNNVLDECFMRAKQQDATTKYLDDLKGGFTGVVGILKNGNGPTIGIRFDMDALYVNEDESPSHKPIKEGFASVNKGIMHACGHDGHTAIGLAIAEIFSKLKNDIKGTIKLVFQPAEEIIGGAKPMVLSGILDDVDFILSQHLFSGTNLGTINSSIEGFVATHKFEVNFEGAATHACRSPEEGNNALLAASTAVLNMHSIPRHSGGITRVNVGKLVSGTSGNIIPAYAHMDAEVRGENSELNDYMFEYAKRIIEASAKMHNCTVEIIPTGSVPAPKSDKELIEKIEHITHEMDNITIVPSQSGGGSEDFSFMMEHIQKKGGKGLFVGVGADLNGWGHHTSKFDINEKSLFISIELLTKLSFDLMK